MSSASAHSADGDEGSGAGKDTELLPPGTTIDRYEIRRKLGHGGMGVVYAAYDPGLDREVALKLLARLRTGHARDRAHKRMAREAMAMARVSHPNVVTINDIGTYGDQSFLAMELVEGQTLREWAADRPRPWWAVVEAYVQAALGLAAIHEAGVLHRDVKPDNIMIDDEERVRVMDLGLARGDDESQPQLVRPAAEVAPSLDDGLTRDGAVLGTTAYLAPEVLAGDPSTASSDQFALCVALYETLYGERPFGSGSADVLHAAMVNRGVSPEPADAQVPAWLRRVVVRGLRIEPARRYPDLAALVRALRRTRRRVRLAWGGGAVGIIGTAVASYYALRPPEPPCDAAALLADTWDDGVKAQAANARQGRVELGTTEQWVRLETKLDGYARDWAGEYESGCRADHSTAAHDAHMRCLRAARQQLGALGGLLTGEQPVFADRALTAASALPSVSTCGSAAVDLDWPDDPVAVARLEELADNYARARVLASAGAYEDAYTLAARVVEETSTMGYAPLTARARVLKAGMMAHSNDEFEAIRSELEVAYDEALGSGGDRTAIEALNRLVMRTALSERDFAASDRFARMAEPLLERVDDPRLRLQHERAIGTVARERGDYASASEHFLRALRIANVSEIDTTLRAKLLDDLASVRYRLGDYAQTEDLLRKALRAIETEFGPGHPEAAGLLNNLSGVKAATGDLRAARDYNERAISVWTRTHPEGNIRIAKAQINLGTTLLQLDEVRAARREFKAALITLESLPSNRSDRSFALQQLGRLEASTGNHAAAEQLYQRAIVGLQEEAGDEDPLMAQVRENLGLLYLDTERPEEALRNFVAAREALEGMRAANPTALARLQLSEGQTLNELERSPEAVPTLRAAVATFTADPTRGASQARARFELARAITASGGDPTRAIELAEQARDTLSTLEDPPAKQLAKIKSWLEKHR